ncbi:MAG: hypothetical protein WCC14_06175 [Acidobacteriaceae bacterium]
MNWEDEDEVEQPEGEPGPADDPAVQEIEPLLLEMFDQQPEAVFFEGQLAIRFEDRFFHWVTVRALKELREAGRVGSELQKLTQETHLRFYFNRRNRYWRRRAVEVRKLVLLYSDPAFTPVLGAQGELLVDAGLPRFGFMPVAEEVRAWQGKRWDQSGHDLDRIFVRDGIYYGVEIKNRLSYIDRNEFRSKLAMCHVLGLRPLFVARMMPRTYINEVRRWGGYSMIMKFQFYPVSHRELALRVRSELGLPVDCPRRLQDSTLQRFLSWHERHLEPPASLPIA